MRIPTTPRVVHSIGAIALLASAATNAAPQVGVVSGGSATIGVLGTTTTVTQVSDRAVIDWRAFDIAAGETVRFVQPSAGAAVLNRVTGPQFSSLQGTLAANGQVFLVNPNGIVIGAGARIDAASFFASTANVANGDFMAPPAGVNGRYAFTGLTGAASRGTIVNAGTITVADGGLVALVAPGVRNSGTIVARLGRIELASASYFTLDLFGDSLVRLALGDRIAAPLTDTGGTRLTSQLEAGGTLRADGGRIVLLTVPAAVGVVDQAINLNGVARAQTVLTTGTGEILLLANDGIVRIDGRVDASAPGATLTGGRVTAIGSDVRIGSTAAVDASGGAGGGRIVLGGVNAQTTNRTRTTSVAAGAVVAACGTEACSADGSGGTGAGGEIRVYSTLGTSVAGKLDVSAGAGRSAGVVELLADQGAAQLAGAATIRAVSSAGQTAGFVVVIGETLSVANTATIDLRDTAGDLPFGSPRVISDSAAGSTVRSYVNDPLLPTRQTDQPLVFHAYASNGSSNYVAALPPLFDAVANPGGLLFASGVETPVGTLRPNGGAPSSLVSRGADALTPIAVTLLASTPPGSGQLSAQVTSTADTLGGAAVGVDAPAAETESDVRYVAGGRGVAQAADLGRSVGVSGADVDVFDVNHHVLVPTGEASDAQIGDYLCLTPYGTNACASPERR